MAEENKIARAKAVYQELCDALDRRDWHYQKDEEELVVYLGVNGEDIQIDVIIAIDADRQLVRLLSPMPFKMAEDKRMEGAIATCAATYGLLDGSFDYNISDGSIYFRMTASFRESIIGDGLLQYMIDCSCATVDRYNDKFLALNKGIIGIADFINFAGKA